MDRNTEELKITGRTKKILDYFVPIFGSVTLASMSVFIPYRSDQYWLFSAPVGVLVFLCATWVIRKSNPYVNYILQISASALVALTAYRCISYVFSQFFLYIGVLIVLGFIFSHTLPIWNLSAAISVSNELYAPKTWIGKIFFRIALAIAPFAAIGGGSTLGRIIARSGRTTFSVSIILFMGILGLYLAFTIPFIRWSRSSTKEYRHPIQDILGGKDANLLAEKPPHRRSSTSGKRISRNKKK